MSFPISWQPLTITTTSGSGAGDAPEIRGWIESISYEGAYSGTPLLSVTVLRPSDSPVVAALPVLTAVSLASTAIWRPRHPVHDVNGAAIAGLAEPISLAGERLHFDVSGATGAELGNFLIHYRRRN